ncbi:MAG: PD-(D/E)XK nuclease family protein [Thermomicrobiales bacterium]
MEMSDSERLDAFTSSQDLSDLERLLTQFNIFEAIEVSRQELRHSDFLAFLLDPGQPHGLGDAFIKRLVRRVLERGQTTGADADDVDLDGWSLERSIVHRERYNIDICFANEEHRFAVIIENKIGSKEHSDQLRRYLDIARTLYPGWTILPIFLTPTGFPAQHESYLPMDYADIAVLVEDLAGGRQPAMDPAMRVLMTHYVRMLRRRVVSDAETAELCRQIYRQHRRAIDLILANRPDRMTEIREVLIRLIQATPEVVFENSPKPYHIQFATPAWDRPWLHTVPTWIKSGRILLFQFNNYENALGLQLLIGHGPTATRDALIARASEMTPPFRVLPAIRSRRVGSDHNRTSSVIYERTFVDHTDIGDVDMRDIERRIQETWDEFIERELPVLIAAMNLDELENAEQDQDVESAAQAAIRPSA